MKRFRAATAASAPLPKLAKESAEASAPPKLAKESAEISPDAKIEQLRQKFAAKMAEFQHDHDGVEAATAPYADPEQSMQDQLLSMKDSMMHGRAPDVSSMEGLISNPIMQMA